MASARANCGDVLERRKAGMSSRVTLMACGMGPGNAAAQGPGGCDKGVVFSLESLSA